MSQKTSAIRVRTRYETVDDFVVGYSTFFDPRGVFIRTRRLQDVGARLRFELQLSEGQSVFRGEGVVDEVREPPLSATGMHLRITKLDQASKALFERINAERKVRGRSSGSYSTESEPFPVVYSDTAVRAESAVVLGGAAGAKRASSASPPPQRLEPPPPPVHRGRDGSAPDIAGELSGSLLDEIADGIESTFDSLLVGGHVDEPSTPNLGGFFGQPSDLFAAPPKREPEPSFPRDTWDEIADAGTARRSRPAVEPSPRPAETPEPSHQEADYQQPWAPQPSQTKRPAEVAERLGVGHDAAAGDDLLGPEQPAEADEAYLEQPDVDVDAVLGPEPSPEAADQHVIRADRAIDEFLGPEPSADEADAYVISSDTAADVALGSEAAPDDAELLATAGEAAIDSLLGPESERDEDDLGLGDMSLAVASQYEEEREAEAEPEPEPKPEAEPAEEEAEEGLEPEVSESAAAIIDKIAAGAEVEAVEHARDEAAASEELELPVPEKPAVVARAPSASVHNVFAREETGPGLDGLLSDLLEKGERIRPTDTTSELAAMSGDGTDAADEELDPLDLLLSRDQDDDEGKKKKGFFKRIFGKK